MATKVICDACGTDKDVGRLYIRPAVSSPHDPAIVPQFDSDLCPSCFGTKIEALRDVLTRLRLPK